MSAAGGRRCRTSQTESRQGRREGRGQTAAEPGSRGRQTAAQELWRLSTRTLRKTDRGARRVLRR